MTGPLPMAAWTVPELVSALGTTTGAERNRVRNELVARAADAVPGEEIRTEIHRQTGPLQQEVERTTVAAWRHFRRRAFFDALTAWARERNRFGATVPNSVRTRLLAQSPPLPEAILFFRAAHERDRLDRAASALHDAQTSALQRLTLACGSRRELFPPQVHALLVRLHREILFDLGEPGRMSADALALSLEAPRQPRHRPPRSARTVRWLAPGAASVDAARAAWRARRNAQLLPILQEVPPREGLPQDLQLHAARPLLDHFESATRAALGSSRADARGPQPVPAVPSGGRTRSLGSTGDDAAQRGLDALLLLAAHRAAGENSLAPEPRWRNMLHLASRMTPHFERSGIRVPENASVAIGTYAHHKPYAHDVIVDRGTVIHAAAPDLLHIPQALIGDTPGAPREGWFQHADIGSRTFVSSQFQQLFTYLITGLFDPHPGGWRSQWTERLNSIAEDRSDGVAQAQAAELLRELPTRDGMAFLQFIRLVRARAAILARLPSRHPNVERFLDGFFIVDPVPPASPADRARADATRADLADLVRVWLGANPPADAATLFSIVAADPSAQWRRLVDAIFVHMETPLRTSHWFSAARQKCDFAAFGVVASASAVRRAIEHATATFLAAPPSAFLGEYERYLDAVLLPPVRPAPAHRQQADAVYEPPAEERRVRAEDLSGLRVRVAHRYDRRDTTPPVSLWVVVDYIHLERATTQPLRDGASGRLVGVSGMSGNAGSPHIHLDLVVTAEEGSSAPPVGYISFFDFFFALPSTAP